MIWLGLKSAFLFPSQISHISRKSEAGRPFGLGPLDRSKTQNFLHALLVFRSVGKKTPRQPDREPCSAIREPRGVPDHAECPGFGLHAPEMPGFLSPLLPLLLPFTYSSAAPNHFAKRLIGMQWEESPPPSCPPDQFGLCICP